MTRTYEGAADARGLRVALVVSRFNDPIGKRLLDGALDLLQRYGATGDDVSVAWVPGAFELPVAAQRFAASGEVDAVVCLGAVIRGETAHFDFIAAEAAAGITRVALDTGVPVTFGVLTTETGEQALERSGGARGNKGAEAAQAAVEMANLLATLPKRAEEI